MKHQTRYEKSMKQIYKQKRKVIQSLSPYQGKKSVKFTQIEDKDISSHLNIIEQKKRIYSLVSEKELNYLRRINYGGSYLEPE